MIETGSHVPVRRITPDATSIGDLFRRRAERTPGAPAIFEKRGRTWEETSWGRFYDRARRAARGLVALGVGKGDRVAILGPTRSPWAVLDMAAQLVTAVSFGTYPGQTREQIRYLLDHSEAKVVYVDGAEELTPTMKLKRKAVAEKHGAMLDAAYDGGGLAV